MTGSDGDRRAYFRIDDAVRCRYRVLGDADQADARAAADGMACDFTVMSHLEAIGQQAAVLLRRIEARDPELAEYLGMLERKIDTLGRALIARDSDFASVAAVPVNISAGGMAMRTPEPFERGAVLELHLLLLPGLQGLICQAEVVSVEALSSAEENSPYLVRLNYRHLSDPDRDILIRHILRKQGELLRRSRAES